MTHGRYGSELVTLRARRWGCEAGFFCSSRRMPSDTSRQGPLHGDNFWGRKRADTPKAHLAPPGPPLARKRLMDLRRALLRQRYFQAHPQDTLTPEIRKVLARLYPSFLKMMDNTTLKVINALVSLSLQRRNTMENKDCRERAQ